MNEATPATPQLHDTPPSSTFLPSAGKPDILASGRYAKTILDDTPTSNVLDNDEPVATRQVSRGKRPLPSLVPPVPTLDIDFVPEPLRAWVSDTGERLGVHPEMIAIPAVIAAGAMIGRRAGIHPKAFDTSWTETPNMWGAIIGPPSAKKTPALNEGLRHAKQLESAFLDSYYTEEAQRAAQREVIAIERNNLKSAAKRKGGTTETLAEDLAEKDKALADLESTPPRLIVNDATIEKLGELLNQNPRGLLQYRDELTGLLQSMDKPGHENDRPFLLETWVGTGSYTVDRINRGTLRIPTMNLSMVGGIQPDKFRRYIRGAMDGSGQADGLLQRFQLLIWPDRTPIRAWVDRQPDQAALDRAHAVYRNLAELDPVALGATGRTPNGIPTFHFSPAAQRLFNEWHDAWQQEIDTPEIQAAPALQSHMVKYFSLVPRLALLFHLIDVADGGRSGPVKRASTYRAIAWTRFLHTHARKVYANETNADLRRAHEIAELIDTGAVHDGMNVRELYKRKVCSSREAKRALAILQEHGHLTITERSNVGTRPSLIIRLAHGSSAA